MLSHPFTVDRLQYLKQWAASQDYQSIKNGYDARVTVNSNPTASQPSELEQLQRGFEELQRQFEQMWK